MGTASLEVSGPDATRWVADLHVALVAATRPGGSVSRSLHPEGVTVKILLNDGAWLDLSDVGQGQLEIVFPHDESQQS